MPDYMPPQLFAEIIYATLAALVLVALIHGLWPRGGGGAGR